MSNPSLQQRNEAIKRCRDAFALQRSGSPGDIAFAIYEHTGALARQGLTPELQLLDPAISMMIARLADLAGLEVKTPEASIRECHLTIQSTEFTHAA